LLVPIGLDEPGGARARSALLTGLLVSWAIGLLPSLLGHAERFGFWPGGPVSVGLVAHLAVHSGFLHLAATAAAAAMALPALEAAWGAAATVGLFGASALAALLIHSATATADVPWLGASGACAGLLGAFLVRSASRPMRWLLWRPEGRPVRILPIEVTTPAWVAFPAWLVLQTLASVAHTPLGAAGDVLGWTHIGALAFGAGTAFALERSGAEARWLAPRAAPRVPPVLAEAERLRASDPAAACDHLARAARARPTDAAVVWAWWDAARGLARADEAAPALLSTARAALVAGDEASAVRAWCEIASNATAPRTDAVWLLRMLPLLLAREMREVAAATARLLFADGQPPLAPGMALRALELTRSIEPAVALRAARRALESSDLHEAKRERVEALIAELSGSGATDTAPGAPSPRRSDVPRAAVARDTGASQHARTASQQESRAIEIEPDLAGEAIVAAARRASRDAVGSHAPQALDASGSLERGEDAGDLLPDELHEGRAIDLDDADPRGLEIGEACDLAVELDETGAVVFEREAQDADAVGLPGDDPSDARPAVHAAARAAAARVPRFSGLEVLEAAPVAVGERALDLVQPCGTRARLSFAGIQAIAVAAVRGMGPKPVLLIDLAANWLSLGEETLRIVRLRSDRFDPMALLPGSGGSLAAMRRLIEVLLERSAAVALPDREAALGRPFSHFEGLASYERELLEVDA
jgi:membrane associated rhomboid family serine protease